VKKNIQKAIELYKKAAEKGYPYAQSRLNLLKNKYLLTD